MAARALQVADDSSPRRSSLNFWKGREGTSTWMAALEPTPHVLVMHLIPAMSMGYKRSAAAPMQVRLSQCAISTAAQALRSRQPQPSRLSLLDHHRYFAEVRFT
jgi:hypothetical protein